MLFAENMGLLGAMLVVLFFGKMVMDLVVRFRTGKNADQEFTVRDNPAFGVSFTGYIVGLAIATLTGLTPSGSSYLADITLVMLHGAFAVALLIAAGLVNDYCILYKISNTSAIFDENNLGVGLVEAGSYLATSFILAGSWSSGGWTHVLLWFLIGQVLLVMAAFLYHLLTTHGVQSEIDDGNMAAALGLTGFLVAIGWVIWEALRGPVTTFVVDFKGVGLEFFIALIVLITVRYIADLVLLPNATFKEEIMQRNVNAGLLEAAIYIISAGAFTIFV